MSEPAARPRNTTVAVDYDPFAGGALTRVVPTTEPQRELWLASHLGEDASLAYNESVSLHLRGALDVARLQRAMQAVAERHDALRASFGPDGETFCVLEPAPLPLPLVDLSALADDARAVQLAEHRRAGVETPFALEQGRLFRAELLRLAPQEHVLLMHAHHIVCDGWSWWVIVRELGAAYGGVADDAGLPPAERYADYALAEALHPAGQQFREDEQYWLARFAGTPPVLELPADRPRPARRTFASAREDHVLDADLVAAVRRLGARRGASLFATLLGGFATLLSRIAGQDDVVIGIPAAGQSVDGHDHLVGHCVNLLPLRFDLRAGESFNQVLDGAQATLLDAIEHQRYTFGTLLKKLRIARDPSRLPLASVMFNIDQALDQEKSGFPGLALDFATNARRYENFELSINAVQVDGRLRLETQYNTGLFDAATVRRWLAAYETLLRAAAQAPDDAVARLPLVGPAGRAELEALQPAAVPFDRHCRMHEHFERQCDRAPDRIAVRSGDHALDYRQLESRANRIARLLRAQGVRRGALVGLAVDRGADMLAALLGILKAGAGYVPLDPQFPADRLAYMAGDAGLAALLTQRRHAACFDLRGRPVLLLDELAAELAALPDARLGRDADAADPESPAYVIYTSGSTGHPKGVQVPHRAVSNFVTTMQAEPGLGHDDRLVAVTTLSFDIAVLELMLPLSVGAQVVLADKDTVIDGFALAELLQSSGATAMQATPAGWRLLLEAGWDGAQGFKALCGGEPLPPDLAQALLSRCGDVWNLYGPTETTVWSTVMRVLPEQGRVPDIHIGHAIANTQIWILDEHGQPCPRGVPGEICIGGEGVTLGYLGRADLTADRFLPDAFADAGKGFGTGIAAPTLYRTGDRGRWRADGNLEHMGRLDFQVKVRGYRIELGEIESQLLAHPGVVRAVAMAREDRPGDVRLVAYVVPAPAVEIGDAALAAHLRQHLPDYMVPQHFVRLPAIPLLPNGKVDRKSLPAPESVPASAAASVAVEAPPVPSAPRDAMQARVLKAMEDILGRPGLGVDEDFFEAGGHSLLAARLCARLGRELDVQVPLREAFDAPTAARLARALDQKVGRRDGLAAAPAVRPRSDRTRAPLSLQQQRLWFLEEMDPGRVVNNTPSAHRLRGPFDPVAFENAFNEMVRRQDILRTFVEATDEGTVQVVRAPFRYPLLPMQDLTALPDGEREQELMRRLNELVDTPFDFDGAPLFVARLFRMGEQDHVLFFMTHHLIWDGWSFDLFYDEMSALYPAFAQGRPSPLPELSLAYGDFAAWQEEWVASEDLERQVAHWKRHLSGPLEPLRLPEDRPRPAHASGEAGTGWLKVDRATADGLRAIGERQQATLFMTLLAAYYVLLHRLSGQGDVVVGLPMRNRSHEALEKVMGFFVNLLPLRVGLAPDATFLQVLGQVREAVLDAFSCADVPFEHLVRALGIERDESRSPIYQAVFSFQDVRARPTRWGLLEHEHVLLFQRGIGNDLGIWFLEHDQGLSGAVAYNSDILSPEAAERINRQFAALLQSIRRNPAAAISLLSLEDEAASATASTGLPAAAAAAPDPAPTAPGTGENVRGDDATVAAIASTMAEVLGGATVRPDDDFFAIGGHSLLAMRLNAKLARALGRKLPLRALFDHPSPAALARYLAASQAPVAVPAAQPERTIARRDEQRLAQTSLMQKSLWLLEQFNADPVALNLPSGLRLRGALDVPALQRAFEAMVARQSALRTALVMRDADLVQEVAEALPGPALPVEDLSSLPAGRAQEELARRCEALIRAPFELGTAPLFRARLFRLSAQEHVLQFVVHHAVWDGVSFDLYRHELAALYREHAGGGASGLPALAVSYGDFSVAQREWADSEPVRQDIGHWLEQLQPLPDPLELPADRPRPAQMSGRGGSLAFSLDADGTRAVRALAQRAEATVPATLLAAYAALLHALSGQQDLVVGLPVHGRTVDEVAPVMGLFRNTLPVRINVDPEASFTVLQQHVRERMLDALSRADVPFDALVRGLNAGKDFSRHPIYQALFSCQDRRATRPDWHGIACESLDQMPLGATEDLGVWLDDAGDTIEGAMAYNADILDGDSARQFANRFLRLLQEAARLPDRPLGDLDILGAGERAQLQAWNDTVTDYPREATIHALFEAQADRAPDRMALCFEGERWDYARLEARANRIAHVLRSRGIGSGDLVGLCMERGLDMVAAVLGVLKAGAGYVPLDPVFPRERLAFMAEDAALKLLVSTRELAEGFGERFPLLLLDEAQAELDAAPVSRLPAGPRDAGAPSVAYVLYTSGSTGKPKGVQVPHGAVVNFLCSMQREPGLRSEDRLLAVTTLSFDIAALELFLPLMLGARIVLASYEQARDGLALAALEESEGATLMQATPTTWQLLIEAGWQGRRGFRALVGGEALSPELAQQLASRCDEVWNMYGPTETTVWSTCWRVDEPEAGIWIGAPIANTTVHVLDKRNRPCPIGVAGEIWIGGEGVTDGYLGRPELTAERVLPDPFSDRPGARLYRTGDRGRWMRNGLLQHLGRIDFQVKVRGYRIELGEIESQITAFPGIARTVVVVREDKPGDVRLVAYCVAAPGQALDEGALIGRLKSALPNYMVPQHVVALEAIPLLPNGKVDRKALPVPRTSPARRPVQAAAGNEDPRVSYLVLVWSEILGTPADARDNFFDLGGHSMLAVQMASRVARDTGVKIRLLDLATRTLEQIAMTLPESGGRQRPRTTWWTRLLDRVRPGRLASRRTG